MSSSKTWRLTTWPKILGVLELKGRIVLIGAGTGKSLEVTFGIGGALFTDALIYGMALSNAVSVMPERANTLTSLFAGGTITTVVSKTYPLVDARQPS